MTSAAAFGAGFSSGARLAPIRKEVLRLVDGSWSVCETTYGGLPAGEGWLRSEMRGCWFRPVSRIEYCGHSSFDAEHAARAAGLL